MNGRSILLIQTCRFDQLLWVAGRLKDAPPGCELHLLARPGPAAHSLEQSPRFASVTLWPAEPPPCDEIVAPLMAAGSVRLKCFAWRRGAADVDYDGRRRPIPLQRLVRSFAGSFHQPTAAFLDFSAGLPFPPPGDSVLLCGSPALAARVLAGRLGRVLAASDVTTPASGSLTGRWLELRHRRFDSCVLCFPSPGRDRDLLLPQLLGIPRVVIATEGDQLTLLSGRSLLQLLLARYRSRVPARLRGARVAVFQTEAPRYVEASIERLRSEGLYPDSKILMCCRPDDADRLGALAGVTATSLYPDRTAFADLLRFRRTLRRFAPQVSVALFTGRPVFRPSKLLFLLMGGRRRQVFNARLDLYELTPRTLWRLLRRDEVRADLAGPPRGSLLVVQTASGPITLEAVARACRSDVAGADRVTVLCPESEAAQFANVETIDQVIAYPARWRGLRSLLAEVGEVDADIVAATFTGEPVFRKQKLLFWLLPVRHRLAFNRHLDCNFVTRFSYWRTLEDSPEGGLLRRSGRRLLKAVLYLPRFAYLVIWVTFRRRGVGYTPAQER